MKYKLTVVKTGEVTTFNSQEELLARVKELQKDQAAVDPRKIGAPRFMMELVYENGEK